MSGAGQKILHEKILHGGRLKAACAQYGGNVEDWLDLSTGISPKPYAFEYRQKSACKLPQSEDLEALELAAQKAFKQIAHWAVMPLAAPGTQSLIQLLPNMVPKGRVAVDRLGYQEHALCWARAGHELFETDDTLDAILDETLHIDYAVIIHPHNPMGSFADEQKLARAHEMLRQRGGLLIVDEAFCDAKEDRSLAGRVDDNLCVLRSFGKFYGLAGLRLGFLLAGANLREHMSKSLGPWAVSGIAIECGTNAYLNFEWQRQHQDWLQTACDKLKHTLVDFGFDYVGSAALFSTMRHESALEIFEKLAEDHILIRKFEQDDRLLRFGLPKNEKEFERLRTSIKSFIREI